MHIVVGCGRVGSELAARLRRRGESVTVIDQEPLAFHNLPADFEGRTLHGNALDRSLLERAGINEAEALAAVTNLDVLNGVIGYLAHQVYQVPQVVVRNFDPARRELLEVFGLQIVSSSSWGAQRIEELVAYRGPKVVFEAGNGEIGVYELVIPAAWQGRRLPGLLEGSECVAVSLTRAGRSELPTAEATLEPGDILHVSATPDGVQQLSSRLAGG